MKMSKSDSNIIAKNNKPAKYSVIKQFICEKIESGQWSQHSKVPSENELTLQFDVSRMTARRALQELTEQGILVRSQGAGTFVATFKSQSSMLEIRNISDEISDKVHIDEWRNASRSDFKKVKKSISQLSDEIKKLSDKIESISKKKLFFT
jgi:DNA-binding GntR family transcriptional regulator